MFRNFGVITNNNNTKYKHREIKVVPRKTVFAMSFTFVKRGQLMRV